MLAIGAPVALVEEVPVGRARLMPGDAAQPHARVRHALPFLADLLALVVRERGEEGFEVRIACLAPMELDAPALDDPLPSQRPCAVLPRTEDVHRPTPAGPPAPP